MKIIIIVLILFINTFIAIAGTKTISIDFELNETAINRALVSQFNDPNFIFQDFSGYFDFLGQTVPYHAHLDRPTVEINVNSIGIHLNFSFSTSVNGTDYNYDFEVFPSITVNSNSITGSEVVAFIEKLNDKINEHTDIPEEIRTLLISLYSSYKPQIYAANLYNDILNELNSDTFIQQRAFSITDFGLSIAFNDGKFVLKVLVELTYGGTSFYCNVYVSQQNTHILRFGSNIKCTIKRVILYSETEGRELYHNENLNLELNYDPDYNFDFFAELNVGNFAQGRYIIYVLFKTDNTFYYNKYLQLSNSWYLPVSKINY